jgi:DNA-binding GntR family transcriptional regulator
MSEASRRLQVPRLHHPRRMLADEVYAAIREFLFDQRLEPESRLSIDGLARDLGVSPTPVREALARLAADGLVVKEPLQGYSAGPLLDRVALSKLYELRLLLEPEAAQRVAQRPSKELVAELQAAVQEMKRCEPALGYEQYSSFVSADAAFHASIARASGNEYLEEALERLRSQLQLARLYYRHGVIGGRDAITEHRAIVEAISRRDPEEAAHRMGEHLQRSVTRLTDARVVR